MTTSQSPEAPSLPSRQSEDRYRDMWKWDEVYWGTHCVDCYPGNCPFRVYVRDGVVWREEQSGTYTTFEEGVPDRNPLGCQKGAGWSQMLHAPERLLYPLRRAGERGEGKWQRVSWDEALTDVADSIVDAIQDLGPESIIFESTPGEGGMMAGVLTGVLVPLLGGLITDLQANINDFAPGLHITFGKYDPAPSVDDWFHTELTLIWHHNPIYTSIPWYHYVAEARYNGGEVVTIAPDFNPSAVHADHHVPLRIGTDVALTLAMCHVIIEDGAYDAAFVKDQTDLPLLVRTDSARFLRQSDVQQGGSDQQFYFFDTKTQSIADAPRGSLALGDIEPALEGRFTVKLADETQVDVRPVFDLLRERLQDYAPEKAAPVCEVHPDVIRSLARKTAQKVTRILMGWNSGKYYHGDLMERAMCLLLALTGNWGKKGAGLRSWAYGMLEGLFFLQMKQVFGSDNTQQMLAMFSAATQAAKTADPTATDEIAIIESERAMAAMSGMVPPFFFWYNHCGNRDAWNRAEWNDPSMTRSFDDYLNEAVRRGWWSGLAKPSPEMTPRVFIEVGGNFLRRTRGGQDLLLKNLWPKLKMIVAVDCRMNTTGMHSDIILPAATHYEKINFHIPTPHNLVLTVSERAAAPPGEAKSEWEIFSLLAKKIEERAQAKGLVEYKDSRGQTYRTDNLYSRFTLGGKLDQDEKAAALIVDDTVAAGTLPQGTTLDTLREKGFVRFIDWGMATQSIAQASDFPQNETLAPFRWHVEKKQPYPTLTRRAQFYIDHDWFLEAGEELPAHKETPMQGGDYPFLLTSGHNRWSIHSMNISNRIIQNTHRGHPTLVMNDDDALARGIADDEEVRVLNDVSSMTVPVRISPSVRPGQVIIYNGWEPLQHREWRDQANIEPGMVKWLHMAGGYGHLSYRPIHWQPIPIDRAVRVDVEKLD